MDSQKYDKRLIQRNLNRGIITPADVDQHLESLEDVFDNAEEFESLLKDKGPEEEAPLIEEPVADLADLAEVTSVDFGVEQ